VFTDDNRNNHHQWLFKVKYFTYKVKNIFILNPQKNSATATIWRLDTSILNSLEMPPKRASGGAIAAPTSLYSVF
jgi:hypothetical protein